MNVMNPKETAGFGGAAGRVLHDARSIGSFLTGLVLALALVPIAMILARSGGEAFVGPLAQVIVALALARFALQGYAGEMDASILSSRGGGVGRVFGVAMRYALLTSVWLAPLMLLGFRPADIGAALGGLILGAGAGKMLALGALYLACVVLSPPIFLIASVGAHSVGDLADAGYWRTLFRGRSTDLFLVYALYTGAIAMTFFLALPAGALAAAASPKAAAWLGGGALVYGAGFAVSLLGRLCGVFAAGGELDEAPAEGRESEGGDEPAPAAAHGALRILSATQQLSRAALADARGQETDVLPALSLVPHGGEVRTGERPVLTNAPAIVARAHDRFGSDPAGATAELEEIHEAHEPNVVVQQTLCDLYARAGRLDAAVALARTAIPAAIRRGQQRNAAEIYRGLGADAQQLDLAAEHMLVVANTLRVLKDLDGAAEAYSSVIRRGGRETGAVKGLLQVGDALLRHSGSAEAAREIYAFLLANCAGSPLEEFMRDGHAEAERRIARG